MTVRGDIELEKENFNEVVGQMSQGLKKKLSHFQDMKLGVIFHWGLYSQAGIVESWQLSKEDAWARKEPWRENLAELREDYWNLSYEFNPLSFDPNDWASKCQRAGFKYMIFTTKHHDGFTMYDTQLSDYKITSEKYPFHSNPKSDLLKEVFDAFRNQNFTVGAYYSKADWHSPYYWVPGQEAVGRYASYQPESDPIMWNRFVNFVQGQLCEITANYGEMDILWLDAGWVGPATQEDLRMAEIAALVRENQRDLIIVDRTIGGEYENYVTPERSVPEIAPTKPWESNIPLANNWGYVPNDNYKSTKEIIDLLIQVVAKGGNLLLGVGPKPDGSLPLEAEKILAEMGEWITVYGEGIYGTRAVETVEDSSFYLTKKDSDFYVFCLVGTDPMPEYIDVETFGIKRSEFYRIIDLASGKELNRTSEELVFELPQAENPYAIGIKIEGITTN